VLSTSESGKLPYSTCMPLCCINVTVDLCCINFQTAADNSFLRVLDKAEYSAFESTLNSSILSFVFQTRKLCYRKDDRAMRAIKVDREPLRIYGHSKLSKMAEAAILNLLESKIAPLDRPSPKTPP